MRASHRYQVITYSADDGGADDKRDYSRKSVADSEARKYVFDGVDGLIYDGAIVYDLKERRIVSEYGWFADHAKPLEGKNSVGEFDPECAGQLHIG